MWFLIFWGGLKTFNNITILTWFKIIERRACCIGWQIGIVLTRFVVIVKIEEKKCMTCVLNPQSYFNSDKENINTTTSLLSKLKNFFFLHMLHTGPIETLDTIMGKNWYAR